MNICICIRMCQSLICTSVCVYVSQGLITGLACIHNANFLHLDLKPDNLFLSKEHGVKIGDFGFFFSYRPAPSPPSFLTPSLTL
jgi:serine/threonine protein kinase